jgi:hypothetical protein
VIDLLDEKERPRGFEYPEHFLRAVRLGLVNLEPWYFLEGRPLRQALTGLRERYPARQLVPFARRQDNDDLACWDLTQAGTIVMIHDFASPGWEERRRYEGFWAWFRAAVEDMIEFEP